MKYFVTGGTGFIGGRVIKQLVDAGHQVVALVRNPSKAGHLKEMGVQLAPGDITDTMSLTGPMTGVDGVFHIAAWYKVGTRDKKIAEVINVQGTRNVLDAMKYLNIKKGVYTSTLAVFSDTKGKMVDETYRFNGHHLSEYDRTKWAAHYEVADPMIKEGLPLVIVQPGVVYGPGDTSQMGEAFKKYLQKKLPLLPKGARYCWAHVDDVAKAHILAMEKGKAGESYIIAGPPHGFIEAIQLAEKISGVKAPRMTASPGMLKFLSKVMGVIGAIFPLPADYTAETLRVTAGVTYLGDNKKAREQLGYKPRLLEQGLTETLHHLMQELGIPLPEKGKD